MLKNVLTTMSICLFLLSCLNPSKDLKKDESEELNRISLASFLEKGWNEKDLGSVDTFFSDAFIREVNSVKLASNKKELRANMQVYFTGFPDLKIEIDNMVSEGDQVYINWTISGTNTGIFGELQPTGKKIKIGGISRVDFNKEGQIVREEVYYNELSLLQQMGHTLKPPVLN